MIVLNPFLDSLCNFGFKNIGLKPGIPKECFPHPQDVVIYISELGQKPKRAFNTFLTITDLSRMEMMKKNMLYLII